MTLILSLAHPLFTAQVADRLVSQAGQPYDRASNKTLLYFALDGMVSCSYTGLAFLGQEPTHTDTWIADALTGQTSPRRGTRYTTANRDWLTLSGALARLRTRFLELQAHLPPRDWAQPFALAMSGWVQGEGESPLPILCGFDKDRDSSECQTYWHEATEPRRDLIVTVVPGENTRYCHSDLALRTKPQTADVSFDAWAKRATDVLVDEV